MDSSSSSFLSLSFSPLLLYLIHTSIFFSLLWCVSFSVPWFVHYPVILLLHFLNPSYVCFFFFFDCLSFIVSPSYFFLFQVLLSSAFALSCSCSCLWLFPHFFPQFKRSASFTVNTSHNCLYSASGRYIHTAPTHILFSQKFISICGNNSVTKQL